MGPEPKRALSDLKVPTYGAVYLQVGGFSPDMRHAPKPPLSELKLPTYKSFDHLIDHRA